MHRQGRNAPKDKDVEGGGGAGRGHNIEIPARPRTLLPIGLLYEGLSTKWGNSLLSNVMDNIIVQT